MSSRSEDALRTEEGKALASSRRALSARHSVVGVPSSGGKNLTGSVHFLPASPQPSAALRGSQLRSPSPQGKLSATLSELDHKSIVALSQSCAEDLDVKLREKTALAKLLADLKKKKMQYDAKIARKRREVDSAIVQSMETEKKLQALNGSNKVASAEVVGMRLENERLAAEVEHLRKDLKEASASYEKECLEVEKLKQMLFTYRKEIGAEAKQRDGVQQDLRASRTAQSMMISRLDDMEKRNRALKTCVVDTFNH